MSFRSAGRRGAQFSSGAVSVPGAIASPLASLEGMETSLSSTAAVMRWARARRTPAVMPVAATRSWMRSFDSLLVFG
eukprot:3240767-Rhodomonas_salina.2